MKKLAMTLVMTLIIFSGWPVTPAKAAESCQDVAGFGSVCLTLSDDQVTVSGPSGLSLTIPVPAPVTIEVPGPVVTVPVPVPGPVQTIEVPGPVRTVPGPTRTVEVPGPTTVITETAPATPTGAGPAETTRNESRPSQTSAPATVVATRTVEVPGETRTIVERIGYSLLWMLIGALLILLGFYVVYYLGRKDQERDFNAYLQDLTDLAMTRKRHKHEQ